MVEPAFETNNLRQVLHLGYWANHALVKVLHLYCTVTIIGSQPEVAPTFLAHNRFNDPICDIIEEVLKSYGR